MCQWKGYGLKGVKEFAFRNGFDDRSVKPSQVETWSRELCLGQGDESETKTNGY